MTTKLNREKQKRRSWQTEYHNVRQFMLEAMKIAALRDRSYLLREHGDIANKDCADNLVQLCKMFNGDQYEATVERLYKRALKDRRDGDSQP